MWLILLSLCGARGWCHLQICTLLAYVLLPEVRIFSAHVRKQMFTSEMTYCHANYFLTKLPQVFCQKSEIFLLNIWKKKFSFQRNTWLEMNDVVYCGYTSDSRFHWSHRCIRLYACSVRSASLTFNIVQLFDPRFFSTTPESLYRYFHVSKNIELTE